MDKDALQFYLESKNDFSFRAEEKLAQEREKKVADTLKQVAVNFAKKNPDIATHAITGGILGGASELAMPSEIDAMGRPSTNMTQIGKRALLGATMGGIGSGVKQHVKSKIDKLAEDKNLKEVTIQVPSPEKLASVLSPMLQRAGSLIAKNPRAASAALGAGTGLAANAVTGSDAPVFSAVAGGALGALGGKQLLRATVNRANPLLGKDVAQGAVGVMKQNRASQLALRSPKVVNMGATEAAASNLKGMSTPSPAGPRNVPVGNAAPAYSVKAQASNPASFTPTNQPKTSLTGVSFSPSATPAPTAQKADFMSAYRPTRSTANPSMNQARAAMPQTSYSPEMAQTLSKIAEIMKW